MSEGKFKKQMDKRYREFLVAEGDLLSLMNDMIWKDFFQIVDEARKDIFETIDKHIEELVTFWQSKPDPQKQKVAEYYIDAYRCIQHNIKKEDSFKLLKWFGNVEK